MLTLADLIEALGGQRPTGAEQPIAGATHDSRTATSGMLFVALKGERLDGHDYVADSFAKGAIVAFVQREPAGKYNNLDLRGKRKPAINFVPALPLCILVDDCLAALQQAAAFWRRELNVRVVGITGSVGKTTTKELVAEVLSQRYRTFKSTGNFNNEIGFPLNVLSLTAQHERAGLGKGFFLVGGVAFLGGIVVAQGGGG